MSAASRERGAANAAVRDLLARALGIDAREVRLVSGHALRDKIVELTALTEAEVEERLASANRKDE